MNLCDIIIFNIKSANYHCIISEISKSEPINLLQNIDLTEKRRTLENSKVQISSGEKN